MVSEAPTRNEVPTRRRESRLGSLRVLIVAPTAEKREEIRAALQDVPEPQLVVEEAASDQSNNALGAGSDVAFVALDSPEHPNFELLARVAQGQDAPQVLAVLSDGSPESIRGALRAGAQEILFTPLARLDLWRALLKIDEARRGALRHGLGQILSLVSASGGVGVTTVTANLALALRHETDKGVAVLDLDLQASDLSTALNLEPEKTIVDLVDSKQKLDSIRLESALTKGPSGVYLLAAPKQVEQSEVVGPELVVAILDLMRQLFDVVLIDCGRHISENVVAVWEHSDQMLYLVDQSLSAVSRAWRVFDLLKRLGLKRISPRLVINRHSGRELVGEAEISQTLARPIFAKIPRDDRSLRTVLVGGRDLFRVAPKSPLTKGLALLARRLVEPETQLRNSRPAGFLKALFSIQRAGAAS